MLSTETEHTLALNHQLEFPIGELIIEDVEPFQVGFERLRSAELELSGNLHIYPYTEAGFETKPLSAGEVMPSTFYALYARLAFQREFRGKLGCLGIDLFNLPGIVYFWDGCDTRALIPPIVELYNDPMLNGIQVQALLDGVHRSIIAGAASTQIQTIVITNGCQDGKYLPYGIPNPWNDVRFCTETPATNLKRKYRRPNDPYSFMRPLRSILNPKRNAKWADFGRPR